MNKWIIAASVVGVAIVGGAGATIGVNIVNRSSVPAPPALIADVNNGTLTSVPTACVHYAQGLPGWEWAQGGDAWLCTPPTSSVSTAGTDSGCVYFGGVLEDDSWNNNCPQQPPANTAAWDEDVSNVTGAQNAQAEAQSEAQASQAAATQHQQWVNWCGGLESTLQDRQSNVSDAQQHLAEMQANPEYGEQVVTDAVGQLAQAQQWVDDTENDLANGGCPQAPAPGHPAPPAGVSSLASQPGACVFVVNSSVEIVVAPNSECQNGTTDTVKGTASGETVGPFTVSTTDQDGANNVDCALTRPTDNKQAWVISNGSNDGGECSDLVGIGWQQG